MKMQISLSILEYESELSEQLSYLREPRALSEILRIIHSGKIYSVHIDIMRPPLIPDKTRFSVGLIRWLYSKLHDKIVLEIHLMTENPLSLIEEINEFIEEKERDKVVMILQREAFSSEGETIERLRAVKKDGYKIGISLNLPTPIESLTEQIVRSVDMVLLMTVPMGRGGQKYSNEATERIEYFHKRFPDVLIEVDGGIQEKTILLVKKAGAKAVVVGSFLTRSRKLEESIKKLERKLRDY